MFVEGSMFCSQSNVLEYICDRYSPEGSWL
jgi:hypothetical protein